MLDSYEPSECALFSGTCLSKLAFLLGVLTSTLATRLSASFLNYAACSGVGGALHMIGVTGLLAPGLSCSYPRSFHKRLVDVGTKGLSRTEAFVGSRPCFFQRQIGLVARRLSSPGSSN